MTTAAGGRLGPPRHNEDLGASSISTPATTSATPSSAKASSSPAKPSGADHQVVIAFQGEAGIKKLLLSFAPLEKA